MKFSSLFLFITLLIILIVIVLFSKFYPSSLEGMVNFNKEVDKDGKPFIILMYSQTRPIFKIYDNIYYDGFNANVIELDVSNSMAIDNAPAGDESKANFLRRTQANIQKVYITTRNNYKTTYSTIPTEESEEKDKVGNTNTYVSNSKDPFEFVTQSPIAPSATQDPKNEQYQIIYMPLGVYTACLIINLTTKTLKRSILHYSENNFYIFPYDNSIDKYTNPPADNDDQNNGKDVIVTNYNGTKKILQLSKTVWIDKTNGYYIIQESTGQKIFDGAVPASGGIIDTFKQRPTAIAVNADKNGNLIVYVEMNNFMGIYVLSYSVTESKFKISKHIVIDQHVPTPGTISSSGAATGAATGAGSAAPPTDNLGPYSDYYRWLAYWNATGKTGIFSQDYIEKTQIVPPVCPACPTCPSVGVCTNCGGNGGSGTSNVPQQQQQQQPGVIRGVADTAGRTVTGVVDTTADVLKSTGSGATDLLKSTGSGAADLLRSAGSGATDLLRSAGSGTYDFITGKWLDDNGNEVPANGRNPPNQRESISGAQRPYGGPQQYRDGGGQGAGRMMGPDRYNYNGALTDKGGNFIPVTADFSAFGR